MKSLVFLALLSACGMDVDQKDPTQDERIDQLQTNHTALLIRADLAKDLETGWLDPEGCDGRIWNHEYFTGAGIKRFDMAEDEETPGRFYRRPGEPCWTPEGGDNGSKSTWSGDMCVAGLCMWAWIEGDRGVLERHAEYGKDNNWQMGEPFADSRTVYRPSLIGLIYNMIYALGGENSANRLWPGVYPPGLDDYEAHLQVKSIWLRGEIAASLDNWEDVPRKPEGTVELLDGEETFALGLTDISDGDYEVLHTMDGEYRLLSVSETMYRRLEEHYQRMPQDPFYSYAWGLYSGDMGPAITAVLDGTQGDYVRCGAQDKCELAHTLFVSWLILKRFERF